MGHGVFCCFISREGSNRLSGRGVLSSSTVNIILLLSELLVSCDSVLLWTCWTTENKEQFVKQGNKDELSGSGSLAWSGCDSRSRSTGVEVEDWVGSTFGPDKEGSRSAGHDT
jgi:hypothetical protein